MTEEEKKKYHHLRDKGVIKIRLNPEEKTLLDIKMKEEDWSNTSGFVKYILFGIDTERETRKLIKEKNPEKIGTLIFNELSELNNTLKYFKYRYEKDLQQLYREEGVDVKAWINATKEPHRKAIAKMTDITDYCRTIMHNLGLHVGTTKETEIKETKPETPIYQEPYEEPKRRGQKYYDQIAAELAKENLIQIEL